MMGEAWPDDAVEGFLPLAGRALLPMQHMRDVVMGPATARGQAGAHWQDFDSQSIARHWRGPNPVDHAPADLAAPVDAIDQTAVWCGTYEPHFGHFIAEFASRLAQSVKAHPDALYLFNAGTGFSHNKAQRHFWQVLDWFGIAQHQVRFVTRPTRVRDLWVAAQAETLGKAGVGEAYLDLLDANTAARGIVPKPQGMLYVSRAGAASPFGRHAGERYLVECLEQLGVPVLRPEDHDLTAQLTAYANAKTLIFAEGSAMHGRQLLGRIAQNVVVLIRRPGQRLALTHLRNRVDRLAYAKTTADTLAFTGGDGQMKHYMGLSLYALGPLMATFRALGADLSPVWDNAAYTEARNSDILNWIAAAYDPSLPEGQRPTRSTDEIPQGLRAIGLGQLLERVPADLTASNMTGRPTAPERNAR